MIRLGLIAAATISAIAATPAHAQPRVAPPPQRMIDATDSPTPAAPGDVESIDALLSAVYDIVSGPAGERRDWGRLRSLFTAGARHMQLTERALWVGGVEDYIAVSGAYVEERGYFEREVGRAVEQYGDLAQVFSTYEGRVTANGPVALRGINSFQLVRNDGRWWIASLVRHAETRQTPIPARYLNRSRD